ncbi:MAG TPA: malate synthase A [Nocardioidaceae bacterium]|nr:malate synthase A [Nocardioidaceae bacterium]
MQAAGHVPWSARFELWRWVTVPEARVTGGHVERDEEVLTPEALAFVAELNQRFRDTRDELLERRATRRTEVARTHRLDFLPETADVRAGSWRVAEAPEDLRDRRVEMTGPTERKMTINALNSGARVWLADLEDANTPHWANVVGGQVNLLDAVRETIGYTSPEGKTYALRTDRRLATIVVRPRGWHLDERHLLVDGRPAVGALVDFGLYFFHNAAELLARGSGPYFYLPKMESHLEARLWDQVFTFAEDRLGIAHGTVRATVLIETIPAAFEMDEILYELREHASGLNAGRWDYLFSMIKYFRDSGPDFVLPDRASVAMTAPFMRAYTELLVQTCHRRGAFAMGGMAAFIPSRRDPEVNERAFAKVREDKEREAGDGFDGSWVAHPDLVPLCQEAFDAVLGDRPNQLDRQRDEVSVRAEDLLDVASTPGAVTEAGLRNNVSVAVQYLEAWLRGNGAVGINNLMEDAATAEISRSQIWQWVRNEVILDTGEKVTPDLVRAILDEETGAMRDAVGAEAFETGRFDDARRLFAQVALAEEYDDFLTVPAYDLVVATE